MRRKICARLDQWAGESIILRPASRNRQTIFGKRESNKTMTNEALGKRSTSHASLTSWVEEMAALCNPAKVFWCDGSDAEYRSLCEQMVKSGTLTPLNEKKRPGCFLARSHP